MNRKQKWIVAGVAAAVALLMLAVALLPGFYRREPETQEPTLQAQPQEPQTPEAPEAPEAPEEPRTPEQPEEPGVTEVEMTDLNKEDNVQPQPEAKPADQPEAKPEPQPETKPESQPQPDAKPDPQPEQKPDYQEAGPDEADPNQPPVAPDPQPEPQPQPVDPAPYQPEPYEPQPYQPPVEEELPITLPYQIPDTDLVIDTVRSYSGVYLEDGSDTETNDVAAMVLINNGRQCLDFAKITLEGTEKTLVFEASGLAAGAKMVVMEANQSPMVRQSYDNILSDVAFTEDFELSRDQLQLEELGGGVLRVTNLTQEDIPCIRLFYKFYMANKNVYVGGITYVVKIDDLAAGASTEVTPSHYAEGKTKVIMLKTYDSDAE